MGLIIRALLPCQGDPSKITPLPTFETSSKLCTADSDAWGFSLPPRTLQGARRAQRWPIFVILSRRAPPVGH